MDSSSIIDIKCNKCKVWVLRSSLNISDEEFQCARNSKYWNCPSCKNSPYAYSQINFCPVADDSNAIWGSMHGAEIFNAFNKVYDEIVQWEKNVFKIPTGLIGQNFIREISVLVREFVSGTALEKSAMTMVMVIGPLLLQKPSKRSKTKDHIRYLEKRLNLWREGNLSELLKEGRAIQRRLTNSKRKEPEIMKIFTRLMLQGKISAAMKWILNKRGSLKSMDSDSLKLLQQKHPGGNISEECDNMLFGPIYKMDEVIFEEIDEMAIYNAAKAVKGACGPSGMDGDIWQKILCSKSFRSSSINLRDDIAQMARKLATEKIDPMILQSYTNGRLIPLEKADGGIRPIGIGEVLRRVIGKAIMKITKSEIVDATAPVQTCGGIQVGIEGAIHAMRDLYNDENTEGVLLVDAENAFNSLNRKTALHNVQIMCPHIAIYLLNTYRCPSKLFLPGGKGKFILSEEGTTQGDNSAMGFYALGLVPLIKLLKKENEVMNSPVTQIWYADDGGSGGKLQSIATWWNNLKKIGPSFGYYPKPSKSWLIVKGHLEEEAKSLFPDVKISCEGHEYLGSYIGNDEFKDSFMNEKISEWLNDISIMSKAGEQEPQLVYAAYIFALSKRWNFIMRTTPNISQMLTKVDEALVNDLLPVLTGRVTDHTLCKVYSLPVRMGGLAIGSPSEESQFEYENSVRISQVLVRHILEQKDVLEVDRQIELDLKNNIAKERDARMVAKRNTINEEIPEVLKKSIELASEKGASSWLSNIPSEEYGFVLNKQEFIDAISLRYNFPVKGIAKKCICGSDNSVDHSLICKRGGYVNLRHNNLRDTIAGMLGKVCRDVMVEPVLLPLSGETFSLRSANTAPEARLDISAINFWQPLGRSFFDIRILHPGSPSYANIEIERLYKNQEQEKKRLYNERVIEVERGTFTPLVFSTSGGMGPEAVTFIKKLSSKLAAITNQSYANTISYLRNRIRFDILKTCIIALRGHRGRHYETPVDVENLDVNLLN